MKCSYKDIFGKPNEGIHSRRFLGVAFWDTFMTVIGALALAYFYNLNVYRTLAYAFLSGILLHRIFCVQTTIDKTLFKS